MKSLSGSSVEAKLLVRGDQCRLQGDDGLRVGLDGAAAGDAGQPDRLDDAVGELRCRDGTTGEDLAGGVLGVDRVALAVEASFAGARRAAHLDDLDGVTAQEPGDADPVAAGALDPERVDTTERAGPLEQLGVALVVRRDVELAETAAEPVDDDGDVFVLVGVDPDDDIGTSERDAGHDGWPP